jgi:acetyl-CoA acetyltransferase
LEAPQDEEAIKHAVDAAELVASAAGEPPDELPEAAREWVERHGIPPEDLVELAVRSMKEIANANEWWRERINDLRYRLGDIAAPYQP